MLLHGPKCLRQCIIVHQTIRIPFSQHSKGPLLYACNMVSCCSDWRMRVWRLINRNLIQIRDERAYRGTSHALPLTITPNRKRCFSTLLFRQERGDLLTRKPFSQWKTITTWPMKNHCTSTPSFLQWILCLQQPFWTLPFLYKRKSLSFVLWTWQHLPLDYMSPIAILCSQINSICWRSIWLTICLRSTRDLASVWQNVELVQK